MVAKRKKNPLDILPVNFPLISLMNVPFNTNHFDWSYITAEQGMLMFLTIV